MTTEKILCDLTAFVLGLFFLCFALLSAFAHSPKLGTFGARFSYEMQVVMGGLLGISNYMTIETVVLGISAWGCIKCITFPPTHDHMPTISLTVALCYFFVLLFYGWLSGTGIIPFIPFFILIAVELSWRIIRFTDAIAFHVTGIAAIGSVSIALFAIWRMYNRVQRRQQVNQRFVRILNYLQQHPQAKWKHGNDAPDGFNDYEASQFSPS